MSFKTSWVPISGRAGASTHHSCLPGILSPLSLVLMAVGTFFEAERLPVSISGRQWSRKGVTKVVGGVGLLMLFWFIATLYKVKSDLGNRGPSQLS